MKDKIRVQTILMSRVASYTSVESVNCTNQHTPAHVLQNIKTIQMMETIMRLLRLPQNLAQVADAEIEELRVLLSEVNLRLYL